MAEWSPTGNVVYVSADGDDMGSKVSAAILSGDTTAAKKLSILINLGGKLLDSYAKKEWKGKSIISGGDDIMVEIASSNFDSSKVEGMRSAYRDKVKATLSCGVGSTPIEAMKAIVVAKNTGKDKAVFWTDDLQKTYKKVIRSRINTLKTKLRAEGGDRKVNESTISKSKLRSINAVVNRSSKRLAKVPVKQTAKKPRRYAKIGRKRDVDHSNSPIEHKIDAMRSFRVQLKTQQKSSMSKARRAEAYNDHAAAHIHRRNAKMAHAKLRTDPNFVKLAKSMRNTKDLPRDVANFTQSRRDVIARDIRGSRDSTRKKNTVSALIANLQKVGSSPVNLPKFSSPQPVIRPKTTSNIKFKVGSTPHKPGSSKFRSLAAKVNLPR